MSNLNLNVLRADGYNISILKMDEDTYKLEFTYFFDKNSEEQRRLFNDSLPAIELQAKSLTSIPNTSCTTEINKDDFIFKVNIVSDFKRIADAIAGEFIHHGSLGKATLSQLFGFATLGMVCSLEAAKAMKDDNNAGLRKK